MTYSMACPLGKYVTYLRYMVGYIYTIISANLPCRSYTTLFRSHVGCGAVSMDSILLTGVLDAHENRAIAILDIANAFLHA